MAQGMTSSGTTQNMVNSAPPQIIMVPTPAQVRPKLPYEKRFPKKVMIVLSSIQLIMGILGIITQVVQLVDYSSGYSYGIEVIGTGIWCGVLFGLSGLFGIIASTRPSFSTIITFMIFAIISASFCLPLLVISSMGTSFTSRYGYRSYYGHNFIDHIMFAFQVVISLIQATTAIVSSAMTCRATCGCCKPSKGKGVVYYTNDGANGIRNIELQQVVSPLLQPGYIAVPISQVQSAVNVGAMGFPNENAWGENRTEDTHTPPPKYESAEKIEDKNEEINGSTYQRFE